jgi:Flp pilus assembly protein TadD
MELRDKLMQQAISAHQSGHLAEAQTIYRSVAAGDPADAGAIHLLGVVAYQREAPEQAIEQIGRAIRVNAEVAAFYNNLALALIDHEDFAEALRAVRTALVLNPDYGDANVTLGAALRELGRGAEAEACGRRAVALNPGLPSGWNNLGLTLRRRGRHEEAVRALQLAISLDPGNAKATHNLGLTWTDLGRKEAKVAMVRSLRLIPDQLHYFRNFSVLHDFKREDEWLVALEGFVGDLPGLSKERQIELHFALAKAYDDIGEKDRGFDHLMTANRLKRQRIRYDEAATLTLFRNIRATFDRGLFDRRRGDGDPSEMPVFIVGMPRSGTSLIEQIMASHSQVHGAGELNDFGRLVDELAARHGGAFPEFVPELEPSELQRLGQEYLDVIGPLAGQARFVTDKMPGNLPFAGMIHLALPRARIIMVQRDPVDTCLSCFSKHFTGALSYTYDLGELGRFAHAYAELQDHWRSVLPAERVLTVRYEDVVGDVEAEARRLIAFCGLPWEPGCLQFHRTERAVRTASTTQVRRPIYKSSVGRWRPDEGAIAPLLLGLRGEEDSQRRQIADSASAR